MLDNLEFSKEWLTKKMIETKFKDKKELKTTYVTISKYDLFRLIIKFVELNEKIK